MNCLQFRRAVLSDPRRPGDQAAAHVGQCAACAGFLAHALESEDEIAAALRIEPPGGLAERLLGSAKRTQRPWRRLALAASLLVAAALGYLLGAPRTDPLALAAIDFVVFDEAHAIAVAKPPDMQALVDVSRKMQVSLSKQLGELRYICVYPFAGAGAHHLLVSTPLGKVTLLLMPEVGSPPEPRRTRGGVEPPSCPPAPAAIIGESARSIERVETLLLSG